MKKYVIMSAAIIAGFLIQVSGQDRLVNGTVKCSNDSTPLYMVSVVLKGTTIGTTTGEKGDFSLKIPVKHKAKNSLRLSFIGRTTLEVEIPDDEKEEINVYMAEEFIGLSEVTIVYDTMTGQSWSFITTYGKDTVTNMLVHFIDSIQPTERLRPLR